MDASLRQLFSTLPERATVVDVSARDGLQSEAVRLDPSTRARWIRRLLDAGLPEVEAGSFVHPGRVPQMAGTEEVLRGLSDLADRLWVLVPNSPGLQRAVGAGARNAVLLLSATETHSRANLGRGIDEAVRELSTVAESGQTLGLRLRLAISMAWVDPVEGPVPAARVLALCRRAAELGIPELTLCDTYGGASPRAVAELLGEVSRVYPLDAIGLHLHDTFGVAGSNVLAGLLTGVRRFDASLGGLGGCPFAPGARGNASTEEIVYLLESLGVKTGVRRDQLEIVRAQCLSLLTSSATKE